VGLVRLAPGVFISVGLVSAVGRYWCRGRGDGEVIGGGCVCCGDGGGCFGEVIHGDEAVFGCVARGCWNGELELGMGDGTGFENAN